MFVWTAEDDDRADEWAADMWATEYIAGDDETAALLADYETIARAFGAAA